MIYFDHELEGESDPFILPISPHVDSHLKLQFQMLNLRNFTLFFFLSINKDFIERETKDAR